MATVVAFAALLSGSTKIIKAQAIPAATSSTLKITEVTVTTASDVTAPQDINSRLKEAVQKAVETRNPNGTTPARLSISVTRFKVVGKSARFFAGGFVGSDKLYLQVDVLDVQTGTVIGKFDVQRSKNEGSKGVVIDAYQTIINSAAEGVADGIFGVKPK